MGEGDDVLIDSFKRGFAPYFLEKCREQGSSFRSFGSFSFSQVYTVTFSKPLRVSNHISLVFANNLQEKRKDALRRSSQSIALARRWDP